MKLFKRVEVYKFLTLALDGGKWQSPCPGHFTPEGRASGSHWIRCSVTPGVHLNAAMKRQIFSLLGISAIQVVKDLNCKQEICSSRDTH
jgi:hypothetical protein